MPPDLEQRAFAVIIPVYNHEGRVREVASAAAGLGIPVIVVDDGSTDGSYEAVRDLPDIEILRHPKNQGKGAALLTGFARAAGFARWAVTLDADGQHDPAEIPGMIQTLGPGERAIVVGAREGMDGIHVPWTSRFGRKFSNFWVWIAGGARMTDSQSGFRIYPLPETLHLDVAARRFQYEVEVLVKARWKGLRVREVPVTVSYHPGMPRISHFRPFIDFIRNSKTFSRLILRRIFVSKSIRGKRPPTT